MRRYEQGNQGDSDCFLMREKMNDHIFLETTGVGIDNDYHIIQKGCDRENV